LEVISGQGEIGWKRRIRWFFPPLIAADAFDPVGELKRQIQQKRDRRCDRAAHSVVRAK
jgi:hypothetical protein